MFTSEKIESLQGHPKKSTGKQNKKLTTPYGSSQSVSSMSLLKLAL